MTATTHKFSKQNISVQFIYIEVEMPTISIFCYFPINQNKECSKVSLSRHSP